MARTSQRHAPPTGYVDGTMETRRFSDRREAYWTGIQEILQMGIAPADLIHHAPAFAGHVNLARFLALYEAYKMTLPLAGHIAEAGIWKGTCSIFFAKLTRMFEHDSNTLVHGFDWFQGARMEGDEVGLVQDGLYHAPFEWVEKLVSVQGLNDVIRVHNLDLEQDLPDFFRGPPTSAVQAAVSRLRVVQGRSHLPGEFLATTDSGRRSDPRQFQSRDFPGRDQG